MRAGDLTLESVSFTYYVHIIAIGEDSFLFLFSVRLMFSGSFPLAPSLSLLSLSSSENRCMITPTILQV